MKTKILSITLLITLIALWQLTASPNSQATPLAQTRVEEAARAVVRVRGCHFTNCNASLGSGAIIHPSGIILTAWHVTALDPENQATPAYYNDFIIEVTDDVGQAPQPRYRAQVMATNPQDDLALLHIYLEENSGRIVEQATLDLPWLPISNVTPIDAELRLMGYPPNGGDTISYPTFGQSGLVKKDGLIKVQGTVSQGFSGGPALVDRPTGFEIVGVVSFRVGELGEVGFIRNIEQLDRLAWWPGEQRMWAEDARLVETLVDGRPTLQLEAEVHTLGYRTGEFTIRPAQLVAYVFDGQSGRAWKSDDPAFQRSPNGQMIFAQTLSSADFVKIARTQLPLPFDISDPALADLRLQLLIWDRREGRVWWKGAEWVAPPQNLGKTMAALPTETLIPPTPIPTDTLVPPTMTETPFPTAMSIPPTSTLISTDTSVPPTSTPIPTPTLGIGSTYVNPIDGAIYVYVPAGEFIMGSTDEQVDYALELCKTYWYKPDDCRRSWYKDEQPQHTVYLDSYWIMEKEMTNAQYRRFMEAGGYTTEEYWSPEGWTWRDKRTEPGCWDNNNYNGDEQPVVCITWYEAEAYAKWLSIESGLDFGLPTEAQWEKAARETDGRLFPWGDEWGGSRLNYCDKNCTYDWADQTVDDGYQYSAPVGSYPSGVSPYGAGRNPKKTESIDSG